MNNQVKRGSLWIAGMVGLCLCLGSCVDYLNKAPESNISDKEVFGNFYSFQGWVEEMYVCIANPHQRLAGDYYHTFNTYDMLFSEPMYWDNGDYWSQLFLFPNAANNQLNLGTVDGTMQKRVWPLAWYAIRKANLGLEKLDLLEGTQEEKDLIKGQCLFFRAFFHLELMQYWGGLPYIDKALSVNEVIAIPRLTYRETALRAAEDFRAAAELLPTSWANTNTLVKETDGARITKIHALGYLGRDLLYAASPMMNESSTGVNAYDPELCKQAAEALAEVIRLCELPDSKFKLETWENWVKIFAVSSAGMRDRPGGTEVIHNQTIYEYNYTRYTTTRAQSPAAWGAGNNKTEAPTQDYVNYYHMANGLPIDDPASGYNPNNPWVNREPRFYNDIIYHGVKMINNPATDVAKANQYAQLDNKGIHRHGSPTATQFGSVTGYFYKKFLPLGMNPFDGTDWTNLQAYEPRLRMSDIYLMYAEAVYFGYGSASSSYPGSDYTAQSAIEKIRTRAQLPALPDKYYNSDNFMETLIRERAVELAFEGFRWFDLRRWNLAGELKYRQKHIVTFDVDSKGVLSNFQYPVRVTRVFEKRHNWVPFQTSFTRIYEGFPQNPGW